MAPKAMKAKGSSKPKAGPMKALKKPVKAKAGPMKSKAKAKPQCSTPHKKLGQLGSNDLLYKPKVMASKGRPYPLKAYKSCHSWAEKREVQSKLELDPDLCWLVAEEKEYISTTESQDKLSGPMYLWDVARVNGVAWDPSNKAVVDFVKSLVAGCEEVQPEDENMLDQGHKQYIYQKTMENRDTQGRGRMLAASKQAKIENKEEYKAILEQFGKGQDKKKAKVPAKKMPVQDASSDAVRGPGAASSGAASSGAASSGPASSGVDADDKQKWFCWAGTETSNLQKSIDRSEEVLVVAKANPANPWATPKLIKDIDKVVCNQRKVLAKVNAMKILHAMTNASAFKGKKFDSIKGEAKVALSAESPHVATVRVIFVNQGLLAAN